MNNVAMHQLEDGGGISDNIARIYEKSGGREGEK